MYKCRFCFTFCVPVVISSHLQDVKEPRDKLFSQSKEAVLSHRPFGIPHKKLTSNKTLYRVYASSASPRLESTYLSSDLVHHRLSKRVLHMNAFSYRSFSFWPLFVILCLLLLFRADNLLYHTNENVLRNVALGRRFVGVLSKAIKEIMVV